MKKSITALLLAGLLALSLAGCGGEDETPSSSAPSVSASEPSESSDPSVSEEPDESAPEESSEEVSEEESGLESSSSEYRGGGENTSSRAQTPRSVASP